MEASPLLLSDPGALDVAVEDSCPLSPMQQGMLYQHLLAPGSGVDVEQIVCELPEPVDERALERAWALVAARRAALRTSFRWRGLAEPLQQVESRVELPWNRHDWRVLSREDGEVRFRRYLAEDRRRGFDLERAPLSRLALFRLGEERFRLVWTVHHAVLDGRSFAPVLRDAFDLCDALACGRPVPLARGERRYGDYVAELSRQDGAAAERYWRERLEGFRSPTVLPAPARRIPPIGDGEPGETILRLAPEICATLRDFARRHALSPSTLLYGVWALLLARWSGEEDVVFGTVTSGRGPAVSGDHVGLFIHTLPVRAELPGDQRLIAWLKRLRAEQLLSRSHEHVPLPAIQGWSGCPAGTPLFETLLVFDRSDLATSLASLGGPWSRRGFRLVESTGYPLTAYATSDPEFQIRLVYDRSRFDDATISRMRSHLATLFAEIASNPDRRLAALPMLPREERRQVLFEWNRTRTDPLRESAVHRAIEAQSARTPERTAVVCGAERVTYGQLDRMSNRLARKLRSFGVGPEVAVGLCVERSVGMIAAMLAILKAGGAYVPLDPDYPADRLALILSDSAAPVLVTQRHLAERLPKTSARTLCLDSDAAEIAGQPAAKLPETPSRNGLAYLIYTSGSTGRPKGVLVTHGNVLNFFAGMDRVLSPSARPGVWLALTGMGFDISVLELLWTLARGFEVVIASARARELSFVRPRGSSTGEDSIPALLTRHGVTHVQCTPALARLFVSEPETAGALGGIQEFLVGGEPLPEALAEDLLRAVPGAVRNMYGPTETTVWSSSHRLSLEDEGPVSVGRPIANTQIYILDGNLEPVPIGVAGEVFIGGAGVTRGYWGRPDLTRSNFLPDPFSSAGEGETPRLYRTGDFGRWRENGEIELLGRRDEQVKIRGHRIEAQEVECALERHPGVAEAAVAAREDRSREKRLIAYFTASGWPPPTAEDLRRYLGERLPEAFVPSAFVRLEALPRTPNGKLDRRALPEPGGERPSPASGAPAPSGRIEKEMARIWSAVFDVDAIGMNDDFFELGGHSLLALRLVSRASRHFGIEIPLKALAENPTLRRFSAAVAVLANTKESATLPTGIGVLEPAREGLARPGRFDPFPLTSTQEAYWIGRRKAFELGNISTQTYLEFDISDLDLPRAEAALRRLIERHDILRAIVLPDGRQQVLERVPPYRIEALDLYGEKEEEIARQLLVTRERLSRGVLPADRWPLFDVRVSLVGRWTRVHIVVDSLIADARSWKTLEREFLRFYRDPDAPLAELRTTFREHVLAGVAARDSATFERARAYWMSRLDDLPGGPDLPLARSPGSIERPLFAQRRGRLAPFLWRRFAERAARSGVTASVAVLAAFADVLAAWSRGPRMTINLPTFHRPPGHPQTDGVVGVFTSLTLLETDSSEGTFEERARRVQRRLWEDFDHADFSGVEVLREIARSRGPGASRFPVVFTSRLFQDEDAGSSEPPPAGELGQLVYRINQAPQVWLELEIAESAGGLAFWWNAVEELFPPGLLDDLSGAFEQHLEILARQEEPWRWTWPESARALLPPEQSLVRARVNATASPVPALLLHQPFEERARERPDAVAVVSGGSRMTYGELDRLANGLASRLREMGAAAGRPVAVVMEKGWEQVVAVLAILKSGAAFLPVEHPIPPERLRYFLEHGEVTIALTQPPLEASLAWPEGVRPIVVECDGPGGEAPRLPAARKPEDLAYVMYTSGSTGTPKGVMIDHRGAVNTVLDINERFGIGPGDRVLALSSLAFDLSVYDVFGTLAAGGTIVLPDSAGLQDPSHWAEVVRRENVTVWNTVPALMKLLIERVEGRPELSPVSLKLVLLSGDWTPVTLPDRIRRLVPGAKVVSLGGATEASIWSILHPIDAVDPAWKSIPYGKPMNNQRFHVLNASLEPCPAWVPGELFIAGTGLAVGYWRDPERTRASFFPHPRTGERLYRTGDLGRYLPDGEIEFLGREDGQVKVLGTRVELGEIEAALLRHPAVENAVVVARGEWNRDLTAYVVPRSREGLTGLDLRAFLRRTLPEVMIPSHFVPLEALPRTRNGKVDRSALPVPQARPDRDVMLPETPVVGGETIIAGVAAILRLPRLDLEANLFDVGATSIDLIRIANFLEKTLGARPSIGDLYRAPNLARLLRANRSVPETEVRSTLSTPPEDGPPSGDPLP